MTYQHQHLAAGHWQDLTLVEQLANIGSEVGRIISSKSNNSTGSELAFNRTLELFELTVSDPKNKSRLREVCRARELLIDWYLGTDTYHTTAKDWEDYFYQFAYLARNRRGRL